MDSAQPTRPTGLSMRWVEVTDDQGRSRLEMRWTTVAPEPAIVPRKADAPVATHAA